MNQIGPLRRLGINGLSQDVVLLYTQVDSIAFETLQILRLFNFSP
jgi:hypothetical protein